jgi:hypothetical protein
MARKTAASSIAKPDLLGLDGDAVVPGRNGQLVLDTDG